MTKPFVIPEALVWEAFQRVKATIERMEKRNREEELKQLQEEASSINGQVSS